MNEPTPEQCSSHELVYEDQRSLGYAIWYPQMGGYVGRAVACMSREWERHPCGARVGGCIDVWVWHDGTFPFGDNDARHPVMLHHCDPRQFIRFGEALAKLNDANKKE